MGTWIVGAVVLAVAGLAARKIYKDRRNGKGCGCDGCTNCPKSANQKCM